MTPRCGHRVGGGAVVDVQIEAGLLDLEGLGAVHVRDMNHHEFELQVHDAASLCQYSGVADRSLACVRPTPACLPVPSDGAARIGRPPIPLPQVAGESCRASAVQLSRRWRRWERITYGLKRSLPLPCGIS